MEPIKRVPLVHQVEERIKDLIKEEKLQPGTKLPTEKELCTNLNISRGTVREAFRFLQAKGIVELKTGKGAFVAEKKAEKPSPAINWLVANETDLRNVFELRYAIEPIAAKMTAEKIDEEGIICLKNIHKEFCDAAAKNDANNLALMDEKFHSEIIKRCGNNLMIDVMERLNMGLKDFRNNTFSIKQNVKDTIGPHEKILKAIITKDSAKAEREMKKHIVLMETNLTLNIVTLEDE